MRQPDLIKKGVLCENCQILMFDLEKSKVTCRTRGRKSKEYFIIYNPPGYPRLCETCKDNLKVSILAEKIIENCN